MEKLLYKIKIYPILLIISVGFNYCTSKPEEETTTEVPSYLELSEKQLATMNIPVGKITFQAIQPVVYATGKVALLPNGEAIVSSNIAGKVEKILVVEGQDVKKGQPLCILTSMDLIELQQQYLIARNELALLELEYGRQKELRKNEVGSLADFQTIESKYMTSKNTVESIEEKLKLLGLDMDQLKNKDQSNVVNRIEIVSPMDGSIYKLPAVVGMSAQTNTVLFEIVNLSKFHADIDVYEKDLDLLSEGEQVEIEFVNKGIPKVTGNIEHIIESIDPESRAVPVMVNFYPPKGKFVFPEMAVVVKIQGKASKEIKPTVPMSALMQEGELFYIYYAIKKDKIYQFHKCKVTPGENNDVFTEITYKDSIPEDAVVVMENTHLILAESNKKGF